MTDFDFRNENSVTILKDSPVSVMPTGQELQRLKATVPHSGHQIETGRQLFFIPSKSFGVNFPFRGLHLSAWAWNPLNPKRKNDRQGEWSWSNSSLRGHPGCSRVLDLSRAQPTARCRFVGEGVPLALYARAVRVEGLADADHVQAGLVRQLLHQPRDLLDRLAVDALLAHSPVNWQKGGGGNRKRTGQTSAEAGRAPPPAALQPPPSPTHGIRPRLWAHSTAAGSRILRHPGSVGRSWPPPVPRTP